MKYTPRRIRENVNISKTSPLREFFVLIFGITGVMVGIYILLGLSLNLVLPRISTTMEDRLAVFSSSYYSGEEKSSPLTQRVQNLLDRLVAAGNIHDRKYRVHILPQETVNALALPGGHIVIFKGLLDQVASENELAMILGHELGHFRNRDHLRGLGRGLVIVFLSNALLGSDSGATRLLENLLVDTEMRFSQRQEMKADVLGLNLLVKLYGHAGGAVDFFRRISMEKKTGPMAYLFATHPYPEKRIRSLEYLIEEKSYPVRKVRPFTIEEK